MYFPTLFNIVWSPYYPWKFESGVKSSIGNLLKSLWKLLDESQEVKGMRTSLRQMFFYMFFHTVC